MTKIIHGLISLCLITCTLSSPVLAQEIRDSKLAYNWFDQVVGIENTGLFNGIEYIEQHVTINDRQKFLGSIYFTAGNLVYNGMPYYDVEMKYNVYDDLLLLRGTGSQPLQVHKSRVEKFSINGLDFINIRVDSTASVHGFYEIMLQDQDHLLLKQHKKKLKKFLDRSFTYFEFEEDTPGYAIALNGSYHPANSRQEFIHVFPDRAAEIRKYYREERSTLRTDRDLFMTTLFKRLTQLSSNNNFSE